MPTIVDQALVIRQWDFSETSQTVSLFCREQGVLRGIAKGARREKGRFSGGIDLLTRGEVVAILKPGRDLALLTDWDLQEVFQGVRRSYRLHIAGLYVLDLIHHLIVDQDPHPDLWDHAADALRGIDDDEAMPGTLLTFQWQALCETGSQPDLAWPDPKPGGSQTGILGFDPAIGRLTSDPGDQQGDRGPWRVRAETVRLLQSLSEETSMNASDETIRRGSRLLATYIRWRLDREPPTMGPALRAIDERL